MSSLFKTSSAFLFALLLVFSFEPTRVSCTYTYALDYINTIGYDYYLSEIGDTYWGDLTFESTSGNTESFWAALAFSDSGHGTVSVLKDKSKKTTSTTTHKFTSDSYTANKEIELNDVASVYIEKTTISFKTYEHKIYLKSSTETVYLIKTLETISSTATWQFQDSCYSYLMGDNGDLAVLGDGDKTNRCLLAINADDGIIYFINVHSGEVVYTKGEDCSSSEDLTSCDLDWKGLDEEDVKFSMIPLGEVGYFDELGVEAYFVVSNLDEDLLILSNSDDTDIQFSTKTNFAIESTEVSTGIYDHELVISYYSDNSRAALTYVVDTFESSTAETARLILTSECVLKIQDADGESLILYEASDPDTNCVVGFYDEVTLKVFDYYEATEDYSVNDRCGEKDLAYCELTYGCEEDEVDGASYVSTLKDLEEGEEREQNQKVQTSAEVKASLKGNFLKDQSKSRRK